MLVNALTPEELRVAILNGNELENFQIEVTERGLTRGNIYRGIVTNVQPSLNAAFIDYGVDKHGFLPFHDIVTQQYHRDRDKSPRRIEHAIEKGRPLTVQVVREAEGQKGAALTTNISLAGRYLVFSPWDDTRGVSRKVEDEDARKKLKAQLADLKIPEGAGLIARTNAVGQTKVDLKRDLTAILRTWKKIEQDAQRGSGAQLLHRDQNIVLRVMRDYVDASLDEIIIDDQSAWEAARTYAETFMPRSNIRIQLWEERTPLFSRYDIETMIDQVHARTVPLPSGGSIVIDHTEALVAIDVNSGRNTRGSSQEETAISTNLEAARAVAKQLRLRDIGGLIVVDFIDMRGRKGRTDLVKTLREEMKSDKARSTIGTISENGLLEINRQRIQQALHLRTRRPCPTCDGSGRIASPEMIGLNLLRKIEGRAVGGTIGGVRVALHPELADALQNGRRAQLAALESEFGIHIEIIASNRLHRPEQEIEWFERSRDSSPALPEAASRSTTQQADTQAAGETGRKKKRRRRKKNGSHAEDVSATSETGHQHAAGFHDEDDHEEDHGDHEAEAESPGLTPTTEGGEVRRKRRRRRRKSGSGQPDSPSAAPLEGEDEDAPDQAEVPEDVSSAPAAAAVAEGDRKKRRRRRRKSGAGQRETPSEADAAAADEEDRTPAPPAGDPGDGAADLATEQGSDTGEGRKKRRRRRRKRGGTGQEPLIDESTEALDSEDHEPLPSAWIWDEPAAAAPEPRQPRRMEVEDTVSSASAESGPSGEPDSDEVASRPTRSRSRRRRPRASDAEPTTAATSATQELSPAAVESAASPEPPADAGAEQAAKSPDSTTATTRPRRARKSTRAAAPEPPEAKSPAPEGEAAVTEKKPKRRATGSRSRKESPAKESASKESPARKSAAADAVKPSKKKAAAPARKKATRRKAGETAANSQKNEE